MRCRNCVNSSLTQDVLGCVSVRSILDSRDLKMQTARHKADSQLLFYERWGRTGLVRGRLPPATPVRSLLGTGFPASPVQSSPFLIPELFLPESEKLVYSFVFHLAALKRYLSQVSCRRWEEALAERGVAGKCELQGIWPPTPSTFPGAGSGQGSQWWERTTEKQAELNRLGAGLHQKGKETTRASAKTLSLIFDSHGLPQRRRVGQMRKLCECRDVVRRSPTHPLPEDTSQPRDPDTKHQ